MLSTGTMAAFGFLFWTLVARLYTPEEIGVASTLITAMIFISYVSLFGFNSTFVHFLPRSKKRNEHINTGLIVVCTAAIVFATTYSLVAPHISDTLSILRTNVFYAVGFVALTTGFALNLLSDSIYVAFRAAKFNLFFDGFAAGITEVIMAPLFVSAAAFGIYTSQALGIFIALVFSLITLKRNYNYKPALKIERATLREVKRYSLDSYVANLLNIAPTMFIPLIVLTKLGSEAAGFYYLAFMIANMLYTVAYSVSQALFAEGSYKENVLSILLKKATILLGVIIVPCSIALGLIGPYILRIFGKTYSTHSHQLMYVLAAAGVFVATYIISTTLLRILKHTKQLIYVNACYAISMFVGVWYGASHGLTGVGFGWLGAHAFTTLVALVVLQRAGVRRHFS